MSNNLFLEIKRIEDATEEMKDVLRSKYVDVPDETKIDQLPALMEGYTGYEYPKEVTNKAATGTEIEKQDLIQDELTAPYFEALNAIWHMVNEPVMQTQLLSTDPVLEHFLQNKTCAIMLAASDTAMKAVSASDTAMKAVIASDTAMKAVSASDTAMKAVSASDTAMKAVIASDTAKNAMLDNYDILWANKQNLWRTATKWKRLFSGYEDGVANLNAKIPKNCIVFAYLGGYSANDAGKTKLIHRTGSSTPYFNSLSNSEIKEAINNGTSSTISAISFDGCKFQESNDGFAGVICFG